ncbi:hypothetical protein [Microlunatus ginsengisoli]
MAQSVTTDAPTGDASGSGTGEERSHREEIKIPLPDGFDPAKHQGVLLRRLAERRGAGWRLDLIDMNRRVAFASRTLTLTQVQAVTKSMKVVALQTDVKPADGERLAAQFAAQFPGFQMTGFEPHIGRAELTMMSPAEVHARAAVAELMRVKPWQVQVSARIGGGFDMVLPSGYLPSRHDEKLNEVARSVIGEPGWYARFDGRARRGAVIPGRLPSFPPSVPHPLGRVIRPDVRTRWNAEAGDWGRIPIGVLLAGPGEPDGELLRTDFEANPSMQISGVMGSGKGVLINSLITGALAHGLEVGLVDAVKACVDYVDFKPFLKPGFCAENLEQAVCVLQMAYDEGQRRRKLIKKRQVQKFAQLPTSAAVRPLLVVVDEATSLLQAEPVPKGLPKDSPLLAEVGERNMLRATTLNLLSKIPRELRFAGVILVLASQVASSTVGIPTELRANLPAKILLGPKPTENNRRLALANHDLVPTIPGHIADDPGGAARGVGVFEFQGRSTGVFKAFYSPPAELAGWLRSLRMPVCDDPAPTPEQMARHVPTFASADGEPRCPGDDAPRRGGRAPSGRSSAAIRTEMGDNWDIDPGTGGRLTGQARANKARHVSAQVARGSA